MRSGAAEDGSDRGEQVGMTRPDVPGAPSAHRIAGQIYAVSVDAEAQFREFDYAQDVLVAETEIGRVATAVRLHVDDALVRVVLHVGRVAMPRVGGPPADIIGVGGVV